MTTIHRAKFFLFLGIVALGLFAAPVALAHANLVRSEPAADSAQPVSPTRVRLWFSEEVEPRFTTVSVLDTSGTPVDKGDSQRMPDDAKGMEVSVAELPRGLYTVAWRAVSAVDGHDTAGSFSFTVGDTPLTESSPRQIMTQVETALSLRELPPIQEIAVRWLNLLCLILLAGSFAFPGLILFPATQGIERTDAAWQAWSKRWLGFARVVFLLYALMTIVVLAMQAITAGGGLGALATLVTGTRFGFVWMFRALVLVALGALLWRARFDVKANSRWWLGAGLSVLLVISQSLNSHGAAVSDPPIVPFLTDIVHLLGAAIWVGGLAQLLVTAPVLLKSLDATTRVRQLARLIARFSLVAFVTVGAIGLTGAFATLVQVGSFEAFFGTLYGAALFIKLALLVPLLALAALNLIVTRPALAHAVAARADGITKVTSVMTRFNISVAFEIIFAVMLLFIVGIMTSIAPARAAYDPSSKLWLETRRVDDPSAGSGQALNITLGVTPALVGSNDFDVYLRDAAGQPVSDATVVRLLGTVREMDMGTQEVTTRAQGNGHYTVRADLLSMVGTWQTEVLVRRAGHDDARTTFVVRALNQPLAPTTPEPVLALGQPLTQEGLALVLFGLIFGTASVLFLKLRYARWASLVGAIVVSTLGAIVVTQMPVVAPSVPGYVIPSAPAFARAAHSPFRVDAARIESGRAIYLGNCATCHGESGKGDGPSGAKLNPKPVDLTVHVPLHTEGELNWWVTNGISSTAMPAWNTSLTDEQRWEVVAYIRRAFGGDATPTPTQ